MESTIINPDQRDEDTYTVIEKNYDPNSSERICCVELSNNNRLYLRYEENSTIKDLITLILLHKEFKKMYPHRKWHQKSLLHLPMFDLQVAMYRLVKENYENRMDFSIRIDSLHEKGLLKNHKHPFFIFTDARQPGDFPYRTYQKKSDLLKEIIDTNYNYYGLYCNYLPRVNAFTILDTHPELEKYFSKNKHCFNEVTPFLLNRLVAEDEKLDWFIYDDESMNFLIEMKELKVDVKSDLKYIKNKIYFEDKCEIQKLSESDLAKFFVNVTIIIKHENQPDDTFTNKIKINTKTTAFDIIDKMNKKVTQKLSDFSFDPRTKILKVLSLNDYVFDIDIPLISYAYLNECIKENRDADYYIIDNPLLEVEEESKEEKENNPSDVNNSSINPNYVYREHQFENLMNIVQYDPMLEKEFSKPSEYLTHSLTWENNKKDNLFSFVDSLCKDVNKSIKECYDYAIDHLEDDKLNNLAKDVKNYDEEDINVINERFSQAASNNMSMTLNQSTFLNRSSSINKTKRKHGIVEQTPNVFEECAKKQVDIRKMHEARMSSVNIKDMDRPFSIVIRNANLSRVYNSNQFDKTCVQTVLLFKMQLFVGAQPFSKPKQIKWKTKSGDLNPLFNKRIYFEVNYNSIPNFCSLIFKIKFIQYNKNQEVQSNNTIAWVNFRLFDHNKKLKTGIYKVGLWTRPFGDDSYYCLTENNDLDCSSISFEIDTFANPVSNKIMHILNYSLNVKSIAMSENDMHRINEIIEKNPFEELNNYDKEILWTNRYSLAKMPSVVPRLLTCFNYNDPRHLIELEKVFELAKELSPVQALELLSGKFLHSSIRNFAVRCLKKASWVDIQNYLLQLVQGLKYEMDHDSELARFILTLGINYPVTIGHSLFWSLRSEMHNQNVQQRFGLYLEVFLNKIGPTLGKIYLDEDFLVKSLLRISDIPKDTHKSKNEQLIVFKDALNSLNEELRSKNKEISVPLNFKFRIIGVDVEKCKYMKSKKKPLWLVFKNADEIGEDIVVMFKKGDDLRMDMVTLQLFKAMQTLWFDQKLKLKMSLYGVMCTGDNQGMLEMVKNSVTLAQIHIKEGGAIQSFFSKSALKKWIENNIQLPKDEYTENFLLSNVAYCVATFVLGIADRHNDNIMLKKNGELFHIDFGHFLGHFKYKMGIKRERAPFVFTKQFQSVLGGEKGEKFLEFKEKFWEAYKLLRKHSDMLITLLRILLCTGIPELDEKSIKYLDMSLALNMKEEEAHKFLEDRLNDSINSVSTKVMFAIHIVANK